MNTEVRRFMAQTDNRPPPGVKRMVVRRTQRKVCGSYTVDMRSSCGFEHPHIAGSVCIRLYDQRADDPAEPVAIKRLAVENWREADDQFRWLVGALADSD